jgi:NADH:ubiquinone oxidoreductase subunit 5 (subunit L)/multisubunit Na+/H+ antiporter MnhA subunit
MPPPPKKSLGLLGLTIFTIVSLVIGAYYRLPARGERPMHTDEAILAMKFADFQSSGHFQYDPKDFHGPGLHYITHVWSKLAGWGDFLTWTEAQLRTVTVMCGLLLLLSTLLGGGLSALFYLRPHPLAQLPAALGGLQYWLAHDMQTERFYHRTVVALVLLLARLSSWSELRLVDGFSGGTGEAAMAGARRLSFTTSGRSQAYALTLVLGVLLMAAWLLAGF